jgi:hypothetical protein
MMQGLDEASFGQNDILTKPLNRHCERRSLEAIQNLATKRALPKAGLLRSSQ